MRYRTIAVVLIAAFAFLFAVSTPAQRATFPPQAHARTVDSSAVVAETQKKMHPDSVTGNATTTCTYQFTSGSGTTYLQFCVTVNGNIVEFQSPLGVEQLSPQNSPAYEGYGICDITNSDTQYWDYAGNGDSGNWNPPVTLSHTATAVKIERTTSDGAWTLTQTITSVPGTAAGTVPYAKIAMALKNTSGVTKDAFLIRFGNVVPDNAVNAGSYAQNYDGIADSAWGYTSYSDPNGGPFGLRLENTGNPVPLSTLAFREGLAIDTLAGPAPCNPGANNVGTLTDSDGSAVYLYDVQLTKNQTVTVTDRYMAF